MKKLLAVIFLSVGLISGAAAQNSDIVINAYSDAIIDLIVLAVLALIIFKLIRSQNHPKGSVKEIANLWAACGGFLGTLSAGATWHQINGVDFEEFVYFLFINMLIFPTTAYILGLGVGYLSNNEKPNIKNDTGSETGTENSNSRINTNKQSTEPEKTNIFVSSKIAEVQQKKHENGFENPTAIELEAYKEAYEEVASSKLDIPIWSLCFANSESDEEAKRKYIRIRSESILQRKQKEELEKIAREKTEKESSIISILKEIENRSQHVHLIIEDLNKISFRVIPRSFRGGWLIHTISGHEISAQNMKELEVFYLDVMKSRVINQR